MDVANKLLQLNTNLGTINTEVGNQEALINEIVGLVNSLPEGGAQLPTLTNEATAADVLVNKETVDSTGAKLVGTMLNNGAINETMDGTVVKSITIPKGYTDGGTVALDGSIDAELDEQASIIAQIREVASTLPLPLDTSDADATPDKILKGYSAYVNDEKIEGTIATAYGGLTASGTLVDKSYMGALGVNYTVTEPTHISPSTGSTISLTAPLADFGDATEDDVLAGKTFTSAAGLNAVGRATLGGPSELCGAYILRGYGGNIDEEGEGIYQFTEGQAYAYFRYDGAWHFDPVEDIEWNASGIALHNTTGVYIVYDAQADEWCSSNREICQDIRLKYIYFPNRFTPSEEFYNWFGEVSQSTTHPFSAGYDTGFDAGYDAGYEDGEADGGGSSTPTTVTDLTDTVWKLNAMVTPVDMYYILNFVSNGESFTHLRGGVSDNGLLVPHLEYYSSATSTTTRVYSRIGTKYNFTHYNYRILEISGGSDATNTDLIDWLYANGELLSVKTGADLEALGALCDWSTMVDSGSALVVTIRNLHPTYNMLCILEWCYNDGELISEYPLTIECGEGEVSWHSGIEEGAGASGHGIDITNIRWVKA